MGAPPQVRARVPSDAKPEEARRAHRAGRLQAGRAEVARRRSPGRRDGVPARREGVPEGRARRAGVRQRGARGAEGRRHATRSRRRAQLVTGKDYRDKPESPQGAWIAATTFQSMGLFADAAEFDEAIAGLADADHPHYQKFEHAKDAAYNAVVLRVATGEHDKAIANGNRYLAQLRHHAPTPTRSSSRWARRTRTRAATRRRPISTDATSRARRTRTTACRASCSSRTALLKNGDDKRRPTSAQDRGRHRQAAQGRARPRRQVRRRAGALHGGRARPRAASTRSRSRAT